MAKEVALFAERQHAESQKKLAVRRAKVALSQGGGPEYWGITVKQVVEFYEEIQEELQDYCECHRCSTDGTFTHVCMDEHCMCDHGCAKFRPFAPESDPDNLPHVRANMHTVVDLYIKPRTMDQEDGIRGLALTINSDQPKKVQKFVSHSWSALFEDTVESLQKNLLEDHAVFICSFALPQNVDISKMCGLNHLERTPFALAHASAEEVLLMVDNSVGVLERVWVIYELYLSVCRQKFISITAPKMDLEIFRAIEEKVSTMDVRCATASHRADLDAIMAAIFGKEDEINRKIREQMALIIHRLKNQHC
jgi:hypothetical protein